jgi:biopolymer transport protein ExbD
MTALIEVLLVLVVIFMVVLILRGGKAKVQDAEKQAEEVISKAKGD